MFEKLHRIVTVSVTYVTDGNLAIGSGKGDGIRDNLIIREGGPNNNPVITGSSLKGVVRSTVEAMLAKAKPGSVCVPDTCVPERGKAPAGRSGLSKVCSDCLVCQLFGNTKHASRVTFHDARVLAEDEEGNRLKIRTLSRTHVPLTRDTHTAAGGSMQTVEAVGADEVFQGEVVFTNPCDWMVGAVIDVLEMLDKLGIGSKKSAGYGNVEATIEDADICVREFGKAPEPKNSGKQHFLGKWHEHATWKEVCGQTAAPTEPAAQGAPCQ
jgi:CRISPR-associated RAMP protein (TIGR02581 family)